MRKHSGQIMLLTLFLLLAVQVSSTMVAAETEELFDETVQVNNLDYYTISRTVDITGKNNMRLTGQIDVISGGDISVYVLDAAGYQQFQSEGSARGSALYMADHVTSQTLDVGITKSGPIHVVLDNTLSLLASKSVRARLALTYDTPFLTTENIAIIVGAVVVVVVAVAFVLMRRKAGTKSGPASPSLVTQTARKNCIFCGALMHEMARTCPACGKEQPA